jgi:hypothetical protein
VRDVDDVVESLRNIDEQLRDLAYERLRDAAGDADPDALADERKLLQARRAVARAIAALGGDDQPFD